MPTDSTAFQPDWASPPGDTIADILDQRAITTQELRQYLHGLPVEVDHLLSGRTTITIALARRLHETLGGSVEFWMARDYHYRVDAARISRQQREWLDALPLTDMIRYGWLSPPPKPADELQACLEFFDTSSITAWREQYLESSALAAFRTSPSFDSRPESVAVWLRQGMLIGESIECAPWNAEALAASLSTFRALSREKEPRRFVPELRELSAEHGVALVIVRAPSGCRASGAATFLSPTKALLVLSFRYLSDDHFWFSFFHELAHLLLHRQEGLFIDGDSTPETKIEREANRWAAEALIPPEYERELNEMRLDARRIIRFARQVGVSPGIVVGQLQHRGRLKYRHFNSLKRRYDWGDIVNL